MKISITGLGNTNSIDALCIVIKTKINVKGQEVKNQHGVYYRDSWDSWRVPGHSSGYDSSCQRDSIGYTLSTPAESENIYMGHISRVGSRDSGISPILR